MRVSASRASLKTARDNVLLPSALASGRAWRRMRLRPGRWPGLMSTAIDIQSVYQGARSATWSHQVQPRPAARRRPGCGLPGPSGPDPGTVVQASSVRVFVGCLCVGVCKHYPNFKCLPPTLGW